MNDDVTQPDGEDFEIAEPRAEALVESLRAFGYTLPAAVADLIDNSISAKARNVWVSANWAGSESWISVTDNGQGMSEADLKEAMRAGSRSPRETRRNDDLGRFGLGLKTASFSQARELTVRTRRDEATSERRWDLDVVAQHGEWRLLRRIDERSRALLPVETMDSGTGVLWRRMDRVVGDAAIDDTKSRDRFLMQIEELEGHLAATFHSYLTGRRALAIHLNGNLISAWDPFLAGHEATQLVGEETIKYRGHDAKVKAYVLPHHTRLSDAEFRRAAGEHGWNAQQGFYVHRNGRLIVAGSWLGLGFQKEEHAKLARISIEIPNGMDDAWQIDVRKASAHPPGPIRDTLRRIAQKTRARAIEVYRHRGKIIARDPSLSGEAVFVWSREHKSGRIRYRINRSHPVVAVILGAEPSRVERVAALRLIEETIPVPLIAIDHAESPDQQAPALDSVTAAEMGQMVRQARDQLRAQGMADEDIVRLLRGMEGSARYPEMIEAAFAPDEGGLA